MKNEKDKDMNLRINCLETLIKTPLAFFVERKRPGGVDEGFYRLVQNNRLNIKMYIVTVFYLRLNPIGKV